VATQYAHQPVLLDESLEQLRLAPGARVVDGTLGGGGHAVAILERVGREGVLVGLDVDDEALEAARRRLSEAGLLHRGVHLVRASFAALDAVLEELGLPEIDGVLLDLGVSSPQLDRPERGFRFGESGGGAAPLDMRMDRRRGPTAAELLRRASREELERWLREYGELPGARRLADALVEARGHAPLETSADLLRVVREARVGGGRRHHPATLVFQALRIAVNDELEALRRGLAAAVRALRPGGRLVVIAYHSLEDRIVKQLFRAEARGCVCPPRQPVCTCGRLPTLRVVTRRPLRPGADEVERNPRARSARLRCAERLAEAA